MTGVRRKAAIDWADVRRRMARAIEATDQALRQDAEQTARLMEARTRTLARPLEREDTGEKIALLQFRVANTRYAIETRYVREIFSLHDVTPIPLAPSPFIGLANLRGESLPLVDAARLAGSATGTSETPFAVALGRGAIELAIAVTAVDEAADLPVASIVRPDELLGGTIAEWQRGVTADAVIVLDGAALLADRRLACGTNSNQSAG